MTSGVRYAQGFTLVEALVAVTVFALILSVMFGSLRVTSRSWETATLRAGLNEDLRLGLDFLRRQIEQTVPLVHSDGEDERLLFRGKRERLQFVSPLPAHTGEAALHWLTLESREGQGPNFDLALTYQPVHTVRAFFDPDSADAERAVTLPVVEDIGGVSFHYFGSERSGDPPRWHDSWDSTLSLPKMVRIVLDHGHPTQHLPELIIPIRADAQSADPPFLVHASPSGAESIE